MKMPNFRRGFLADSRLWVLLIPALAVLAIDMPVMLTLLYSLSAMMVVLAMAHFMRRILMHYIDLEEMADIAADTPLGAGLIFLGVALITSSIVIATSIWIAK